MADEERQLSEEEIEVLHSVFAKFDEDGGGSIDEEELGHAMKALGAPVSADELSALVKEIDEDGNGEIDFDECVLARAAVGGCLLPAPSRLNPRSRPPCCAPSQVLCHGQGQDGRQHAAGDARGLQGLQPEWRRLPCIR
jgi:hypothetical protein